MNSEPAVYGYRFLFMFAVIAVNGFFAAAETALISVRPSRLRQMAAEGAAGANASLSLLARPERLLSVCQVGLTITSLGLGWLGQETLHGLLVSILGPVLTPAGHAVISLVSLVFAFLLMTFAHVVLGEVVPKNIAFERADRLAVLAAPALLVFYRITEPFVWTIERASTAISRLFGTHGHARGAHSPEELKFVISASRAAGHLTAFEEEAMHRIVDLQEVSVREVMVPRNQIVSVPSAASLDEVLRAFRESGFSRLPVYEDKPENLIGFVHVKDALAASPAAFTLSRVSRKAPVVPETRALHLLLDDLREHHAHLAFVVDEFGTIAGLISVEDVFEQMFGEIEDEFDVRVSRPAAGAAYYVVEGTIPIRDLETQYGIALPSAQEFSTLAGYLLFRLGRIPRPGDSIEHESRRFTILYMDFNRIARVRVERLPPGA